MKRIILLLCCLPALAFSQSFNYFSEFGATTHSGENTPLWQASNQHGLSSLGNNTYLRGGAFYKDTINHWRLEAGLDVAFAAGFTSTFILQQAYAKVNYKWIGAFVGSKEIDSQLLNQSLSSGGLTWSGNARPIPQVMVGVLDYVRLAPGVRFKAELSYGKWTDNRYLKENIPTTNWYTKDILYHHKSFFFQFGKPTSHWQFDLGASLDTQFGGYMVNNSQLSDLGNSLKFFWQVLIPQKGDESAPLGEQIQFQGNYLGSEHLKLTYKGADYSIGAYLENYYDDFSGMGKLNGLDGLWGIEYKTSKKQLINGLVVEYYQTTNQSGPMHGLDFSDVEKTGGADNYYNNYLYQGWTHWGMTMANPLILSPVYNKDGYPAFRCNRVKAVHIGFGGYISPSWEYRSKLSYNQTWGTPFEPTAYIMENLSLFAEADYHPKKLKGWKFLFSVAADMGDIYGDNFGLQLKVRKQF